MRKFDFVILIVLMMLSAVNSFGAILSNSDSAQKEYFSLCMEHPNDPCQTPVNTFFQELMTEVSADIDREALLAGQPRETYLSSDAPFSKTLEALQSEEFKKLDRVDIGISIVKLGMRYHFMKNTRFVAPNFFENEATFHRLVREISAQHHLPFQF